MTEKTLFAGFGGQGIISLGEIWVFCGMKEGKNVSFYPFYGAEKRGGIARASCVISDDAIASPIITSASSVVAMSQDSLAACAQTVAEGGLMLVNSSLVTVDDAAKKALPAGVRIVPVAATEIADGLGNSKIANMVMLGALAKTTGALSLSAVEDILKSFFPASKQKFVPSNVAAISKGMTVI
jgi:2-oxoglutarate ferredoxin oxidoreductase subunit gamma